MTLKTRVALTGPIDVDTAFDLALHAILKAAGETERHATVRSLTLAHHGRTTRRTVPDQGLPAITDATANDGSPLDLATHLDDALPGWTLAEQTCSALVSWDTGYRYSGRIWLHTEMLHAAAIVLLWESLPADVELHWKNEHTGAWHHSWLGIRELARSAHPTDVLVDNIRATHRKETRP